MKMFHTKGLPIGWAEKRFKYLAEVTKGRLPASGDFRSQGEKAIPYLSMEYLRGENDEPEFVAFRSELVCANNNDILLLWDGANAGEFLRAKKGVVSSTIAKVVPYDIDADFLYWACKGQENFIRSQTTGMGIPHVNGEFLTNIRMPLPDETQQRVIADYLDRETGRMDALVAAKERLLKLLAEKRQALITGAVTRGIDPNARLKPSGVEWLGDVPAHWQVERTRWLFRERDCRSETGDEELLTVSHITGVTPRSEKEVSMFEAKTNEGYKICMQGDLVINTLWAWMGAMGISPMKGIVSPAYNVYEPTEQIDPAYVDALVRLPVFAQEVTRYSKGVWSSRLRLYPEGFFEAFFPVPPLSEQRAIADYLDRETAKLDALAAKARETIDLIKERRAALISAAVTGKIDIEDCT